MDIFDLDFLFNGESIIRDFFFKSIHNFHFTHIQMYAVVYTYYMLRMMEGCKLV